MGEAVRFLWVAILRSVVSCTLGRDWSLSYSSKRIHEEVHTDG